MHIYITDKSDSLIIKFWQFLPFSTWYFGSLLNIVINSLKVQFLFNPVRILKLCVDLNLTMNFLFLDLFW